jgi:hypothetical protein
MLSVHTTFFYREDRIKYLNRIIEEYNKYPVLVHFFIHTNFFDLNNSYFENKNTNVTLFIIHHQVFEHDDKYLLTWKHRDLLKTQKDTYDYFMYHEDDVLMPLTTFNYFLRYNPKLKKYNFNVGFIRIEVNEQGVEYSTDMPNKKLKDYINVNSEIYAVNNINPYCALWLYDKETFNKFVNAEFYNLDYAYKNYFLYGNVSLYGIPEWAGIGANNKRLNIFNETLIPMDKFKLVKDCKIYHMPNNFINNPRFGTIKFNEIFEL